MSDTAGERAQRHCTFLNQCANYFELMARTSNEDLTVQAHHNNARNLIAAANFIAVLMSERTPAVMPDPLGEASNAGES